MTADGAMTAPPGEEGATLARIGKERRMHSALCIRAGKISNGLFNHNELEGPPPLPRRPKAPRVKRMPAGSPLRGSLGRLRRPVIQIRAKHHKFSLKQRLKHNLKVFLSRPKNLNHQSIFDQKRPSLKFKRPSVESIF
jgi:hypothetical protein